MFERELVSQLVNRSNEPRKFIQIVVEPRQTGKATAVLRALKKVKEPAHFISADGPILASPDWLRKVGE